MRFLLKEDEKIQKKLMYLAINYSDYRRKDISKGITKAQVMYEKRDLDMEIFSKSIKGQQINFYEYLERKLNKLNPKYVLDSYVIDEKLVEHQYKISAKFYHASPTYLMIVDKLKYYDELIVEAKKYLRQNITYDIRNVVEKDGFVMIGKRGRNKCSPNLLGEFIGFKKVMTSEEYDNILMKFL
jgi:hypothetical protein